MNDYLKGYSLSDREVALEKYRNLVGMVLKLRAEGNTFQKIADKVKLKNRAYVYAIWKANNGDWELKLEESPKKAFKGFEVVKIRTGKLKMPKGINVVANVSHILEIEDELWSGLEKRIKRSL